MNQERERERERERNAEHKVSIIHLGTIQRETYTCKKEKKYII